MDSAGDQHLQIDHDIFKRRIGLDGKPIDEAIKEDITMTTSKDNATVETTTAEPITTTTPSCGSCYGAASVGHCCQTCQQVLDAYQRKRWNPDPAKFEQCIREGVLKQEREKEELALKEGCTIFGHLEVNRMGGSFHIAPGKSFSLNHIHIHDVHPYSSSAFNTTHHLRHLSFGERLDAANTHPLDGTEAVAHEGEFVFLVWFQGGNWVEHMSAETTVVIEFQLGFIVLQIILDFSDFYALKQKCSAEVFSTRKIIHRFIANGSSWTIANAIYVHTLRTLSHIQHRMPVPMAMNVPKVPPPWTITLPTLLISSRPRNPYLFGRRNTIYV